MLSEKIFEFHEIWRIKTILYVGPKMCSKFSFDFITINRYHLRKFLKTFTNFVKIWAGNFYFSYKLHWSTCT